MQSNRIAVDHINGHINTIFKNGPGHTFHHHQFTPESLRLDPIHRMFLGSMSGKLDPALSSFWHEVPVIALSRARQHVYALFFDGVERAEGDSEISLLKAYTQIIANLKEEANRISRMLGILDRTLSHLLSSAPPPGVLPQYADLALLEEGRLARCICDNVLTSLTGYALILNAVFNEMVAVQSDGQKVICLHEVAVDMLAPEPCACGGEGVLVDLEPSVEGVSTTQPEPESVPVPEFNSTSNSSAAAAPQSPRARAQPTRALATATKHKAEHQQPTVRLYQILILLLVFVSGLQAGYITRNM